jgi:excisionase family DNA binding protein
MAIRGTRSISVTVFCNGVPVLITLVEDALAAIAAALPTSPPVRAEGSPYMTIPEAAEYLRCSRQRVYDLRSSGRLNRFGDGRRALVKRAELDEITAIGVAHPLPSVSRACSERGDRG